VWRRWSNKRSAELVGIAQPIACCGECGRDLPQNSRPVQPAQTAFWETEFYVQQQATRTASQETEFCAQRLSAEIAANDSPRPQKTYADGICAAKPRIWRAISRLGEITPGRGDWLVGR
jgi:hypothetical protein